MNLLKMALYADSNLCMVTTVPFHSLQCNVLGECLKTNYYFLHNEQLALLIFKEKHHRNSWARFTLETLFWHKALTLKYEDANDWYTFPRKHIQKNMWISLLVLKHQLWNSRELKCTRCENASSWRACQNNASDNIVSIVKIPSLLLRISGSLS